MRSALHHRERERDIDAAIGERDRLAVPLLKTNPIGETGLLC